MPDTTATSLDTGKLAEEISAKIQAAKAPTWKVAIWWTLGIVAVVSLITIIILMIKKNTSASESVSTIMAFSEDQVRQAEAAKKIEVARAEGVAEVKLAEIRAVMEIRDEDERLRRLIAL